MLDIKLIRENPELVKEGLRKKQAHDIDIEKILQLDTQHRKLRNEVESLRTEMNVLSDTIAQAKSQKDESSATKLLQEAEGKKDKLRDLEPNESATAKKLHTLLARIPNLPLPNVPEGKDENENKVLREEGEKPRFAFEPKDYLTLAKKLDLIDIERAGKVSGSRFGYLKNEAALLEFALARFAFDILTSKTHLSEIIEKKSIGVPVTPFVPVIPPVIVKPENMRAMGYMERGGDEMYHLEKDDLYLVGTSEQSVGPMHKNDIFEENTLPRRYVAFSTCFRREAGSYGKDTKGILRVHQFDKLEMFSFCNPEISQDEHLFFLAIEEHLMQALGLPYQVLLICGGDLGDPAAAKYDIEAWLPGQKNGEGEYRETHSTSNTTDFQARRLNIRFKPAARSAPLIPRSHATEYVHMLNGTAFAIGRMLIAIFENYQQADGNIRVPDALIPYCGFDTIS